MNRPLRRRATSLLGLVLALLAGLAVTAPAGHAAENYYWKGVVRTASGEPVPNVAITLFGSTVLTRTAEDGTFGYVFAPTSGTHRLVASAKNPLLFDYESEPLSVDRDRTFDIVLEEAGAVSAKVRFEFHGKRLPAPDDTSTRVTLTRILESGRNEVTRATVANPYAKTFTLGKLTPGTYVMAFGADRDGTPYNGQPFELSGLGPSVGSGGRVTYASFCHEGKPRAGGSIGRDCAASTTFQVRAGTVTALGTIADARPQSVLSGTVVTPSGEPAPYSYVQLRSSGYSTTTTSAVYADGQGRWSVTMPTGSAAPVWKVGIPRADWWYDGPSFADAKEFANAPNRIFKNIVLVNKNG